MGIVFDFITGIAKGYKNNGKPSSTMLRCGSLKKMGTIFTVILSYGLSVLFTDSNRIIFNSAQCYYIYMELISILENLNALDVKLPRILKLILGETKNNE